MPLSNDPDRPLTRETSIWELQLILDAANIGLRHWPKRTHGDVFAVTIELRGEDELEDGAFTVGFGGDSVEALNDGLAAVGRIRDARRGIPLDGRGTTPVVSRR